MARIRSIHPGFFTDEAIVSVSMAARICVIGLGIEADDKGIFEWKPVMLKMRLFPADNVDMNEILAELQAADCIRQYEFGGKMYGAIRNFRKFQKPKTPNDVYPAPNEIRIYVGLDPIISETNPADEGQFPQNGETFPQKGEKSFQMEDGGWRMEEGEGLKKPHPSDESKKVRPRRKTSIPEDCPTPGDREKAVAYWRAKSRPDLDVEDQAEKFRAYHLARGSTMLDWGAAWQTWYRNAVDFTRPARDGPVAPPAKPLKSIWEDA